MRTCSATTLQISGGRDDTPPPSAEGTTCPELSIEAIWQCWSPVNGHQFESKRLIVLFEVGRSEVVFKCQFTLWPHLAEIGKASKSSMLVTFTSSLYLLPPGRLHYSSLGENIRTHIAFVV